MTACTAAGWAAVMRVAPSLMIPALLAAISSRESPSQAQWSRPTGVMTSTSEATTLVESQVPPSPTSTTATSTGWSAKAASAMTVRTSKKDRRGPPADCERSSTRRMQGATSSQAAMKPSSPMGSPSRAMRSRMVARWGLVKRPVRMPVAARSLSIMRTVEVLPLVPVTWTTR